MIKLSQQKIEVIIMKSIPYYLYRGGTSKGPFFFKKDLPSSKEKCDEVLRKIMGSPHPYQVDGIGGGVSNASKIGILSVSNRNDADIEYIFGQVAVLSDEVDTSSDCGNMTTAAACCAIEAHLIDAKEGETTVRVYSPATDSVKEIIVPCKDGKVIYEGDYHIDGVGSTGSVIKISFLHPSASQTGAIFPSGKMLDIVDGIPVTLIDCGRALVIARACDFNISDEQSNEALEEDVELNHAIEAFRLKCAKKMNIAHPCQTFPRIALVSAPRAKNQSIYARYWSNPTARQIHPAMAMTAAMALASAVVSKGTICAQSNKQFDADDHTKEVYIGHAQGEVEIDITGHDFPLDVAECTYKRTARLLAKGEVYYC